MTESVQMNVIFKPIMLIVMHKQHNQPTNWQRLCISYNSASSCSQTVAGHLQLQIGNLKKTIHCHSLH